MLTTSRRKAETGAGTQMMRAGITCVRVNAGIVPIQFDGDHIKLGTPVFVDFSWGGYLAMVCDFGGFRVWRKSICQRGMSLTFLIVRCYSITAYKRYTEFGPIDKSSR